MHEAKFGALPTGAVSDLKTVSPDDAQAVEMRRSLAKRRTGESGFTLIETLVALALMGLVLSALANLTAQWLPNWNRGLERIQRSELIGIALQRIGADLAAAEYVSANRGERRPIFDGSELSVTFCALRPWPERRDRFGCGGASVRPPNSGASSRSVPARRFGRCLWDRRLPSNFISRNRSCCCVRRFGCLLLMQARNRVWKGSWHEADRLPAAIKLTIRDAASERILAIFNRDAYPCRWRPRRQTARSRTATATANRCSE